MRRIFSSPPLRATISLILYAFSNPGQILSGLLENPHLGIIAWDSQGRVQVWNRGAERILGWDREELLGGPFLRH